MTYRPEIDGLRAVSVLAVILYHAGLAPLSGGFAGVDVFFVISGFLITQIILSGLRDGTFSFWHFYERRARRILPALFVVMLLTAPLIVMVLAPFQLKDYAQSVLATVAYLSNVLFWLEADYFAVEAAQKPLLHTWSLAIEEQYYLLFPPALMLLFRFGWRAMVIALALAAITSFAAMLWYRDIDASAAFYLIQYRAWELLAGSLAAVWVVWRAPIANGVASAAGMAMVLAALFVTSDSADWPGAWTLIPVAGAVLVLVYTNAAGLVGRVLAHEPLRRIGLMSYSLYLWHLPFLVALNVWYLGNPPPAAQAAAVALTFACSWASWRYVEVPFRNARKLPVRPMLATLLLAMLTLGAFGYAGHLTNGFFETKLALVPESARALVIDREAEIAARRSRWEQIETRAARPFPSAAEGRRILILGDSLSEDLIMAMAMRPDLSSGLSFRRQRLDDVCMGDLAAAISGVMDTAVSERCAAELDGLASDLMTQADEVVLAAGWQPDTVDNATALASALRGQGKAVSVVGIAAFNDMTSLSMMMGRLQEPVNVFLYRNLRGKFRQVDADLANAVHRVPGVRFLDKRALFCDDAARRCNMHDAAGRLPIFDASHLTLGGLDLFARRIHEANWFIVEPDASGLAE